MATTFPFKIATLEQVIYSDDVTQITVPTRAGEIGILARHVPLITLLAPGELRIHKDGQVIPMAVSEGFLEVRKSGDVVILADTAERAEYIDINRAEEARRRAQEALMRKDDLNEIDFARFESRLERELARIKVGQKYQQGRK